MRALIAGHLVLDTLSTEGYSAESMGGPPAYMGLLLSRLGFDVTVSTCIGYDFGNERLRQLLSAGIRFLTPPLTESPTTRFDIAFLWDQRALRLLSRCEGIPPPRMGLQDFDIVLVNPVAGEIAVESLPKYRAISKFLYMDPQGFLRRFDGDKVTLADCPELKERLRSVTAMKVDLEEGMMLTGLDEPAGVASSLLKMGVREVLVTQGAEGTYLRAGTSAYFLKVPTKKAFDGVGAGDLLGAGYAAARLTRDPPASLAYAVACASSRIDQPALGKIPEASEVEKLALSLVTSVETLEGLG